MKQHRQRRRRLLEEVEKGGGEEGFETIIFDDNNERSDDGKKQLFSSSFEIPSKHTTNVLFFVVLSSISIWRILYSPLTTTQPSPPPPPPPITAISTTSSILSSYPSSSTSTYAAVTPQPPPPPPPSIRSGTISSITNSTEKTNNIKSSNSKGRDEVIAVTYSPINASECGIWLAPSTIPGAGIGMFAGRNFSKGQNLLPSGDIVIPLVDMKWFHGKNYNFLWREYYWNGHSQGMEDEGVQKTNGISPGIGAAANCYFDLFNVEEGTPVKDEAGLNKDVDPGYGGFTRYVERNAWADTNTTVGQELFLSYGSNWFKQRKSMEFVPVSHDMIAAEKLMKELKKKYQTIPALVNKTQDMLDGAMRGEKLKDNITNRVLGALPKTSDEWTTALQFGLKKLRVQQTTRSVSNLDQTGACMDNIRSGNSTIPQAGHGAFATRQLPKNTVVVPVPLLHFVNRSLMDTYSIQDMDDGDGPRQVAGQQLLINYCFGHPQTTLLLSGYGYATSLVNHNRTRANVKLRWGDPQRSNHHPEWLNFTIEQLDKHYVAGLAWEMVSLREILPGEEILMDYGADWEAAWLAHNKKWKQQQQAKRAQNTTTRKITADQLNRAPDALKTWNRTQYRKHNIRLMGYYNFYRPHVWKDHYKQHGNYQDLIKNSKVYSCEITAVYQDQHGNEWYNATYYDGEGLVMVPREAFVFQDMPASYWGNEHAFRHDIAIPDDLLPMSWRNRL